MIPDPKRTRQGVLLALAAYIMWGIAPMYFKTVNHIPAPEILAHRVLWSFVFLALLLFFTRRFYQLKPIIREPKKLLMLMLTSCFIGCNWLIFIWAIVNNRMLDASLGYYINPLVNVALGMIFLGERFRRLQWLAAALALVGVLVQLITFGSLPWIALVLATSFAIYGLLRKKINLPAVPGLFVETCTLLPIALIYLWQFADTSSANLLENPISLNMLLAAAGLITTVPLLCFTGAATRLPLTVLGFFQYIGPSLMFLLAVGLYDEPFTPDKATTFAFIWAALAIFSFDAYRAKRQQEAKIETTPLSAGKSG